MLIRNMNENSSCKTTVQVENIIQSTKTSELRAMTSHRGEQHVLGRKLSTVAIPVFDG